MNFRNISAWSIRNPVVPIVLFIALTLAGIVSFMRMDVNQQPDIDFPVAFVIISQPGAAPSELETQVTKRVEAAARGLRGIDEIRSTVKEGNSQTIIQLQLGTDIDRAVNDLRNAITQIRGDLPDGILEPQIGRFDTSDEDIANFSALTTDMTVEQLSWYIDDTVSKELLSVPGLGAVERNGGVAREIRVILDPVKLQAQGLTANTVNAALRAVNLNATGGKAEIAGSEQSVRVLGNAKNAYALGQTQISLGNGRTVRLADIADVRDAYAEQKSSSAVNGHQVVSFSFTRTKGSSDVTVYNEAVKRLDALAKRNPSVQFKLLSTSVTYTEHEYENAIGSMIEGAVLAVIVVFLFLRDWRATFISALAIPLSAIPTFWFMDLLGFSLNNMTLLALSLVAGVLVDDAIVEIENIVRHMRMGKNAYQASIDAADEIGLAVLATTMSIVAVFLPVALMPGVSGQFFKNFGLTVVAAVLMSLAVARLITPMIAAYFLKAGGHEPTEDGPVMSRYVALLRWSLDQTRQRRLSAQGGWRRLVSHFVDHRVWIMGISVLALIATVAIFMVLPQEFQPQRDNDRSTVQVELPPGSTLEQTQAVVSRVAGILSDQKPIVTSVYQRAFVGNGRVTATLADDRDRTSVEFERALTPTLSAIPDARVSFQNQNGWGGPSRDIQITLGSDDPVLLQQTADKIVEQMSHLPILRAPRTAGGLQRPEIVIRPRMDLAADLGVTTSALSNAIRVATLGDIDQNSARFSLNDRQIPIRVALAESAREKLSSIENLPVSTSNGGSVPLKVVADIGFGAGPTQIDRIAQQRQLTIGADLAPGIIEGDAMKQILALPAVTSMPIGVSRLSVGQSKAQAELVTNIILAVTSGFFLLFAVLVLLYRRFLPPFVNLGSLFLAPLGACLALWIAGMSVSLPVYIGLLMLLGIVAKNSILLVDFALEEMSHGVPKFEAIVDAGHKRALPIVMTTVAMVAGMVPTALSLTGDGSFRAPMSVTVIGGLVLSTLLTLLIVPAGFSLAVGVETRLGSRLGRRLLTFRPGDDGAEVIGVAGPARGPRLGVRPGSIGYREDGPHPAE
ncbi:ABC transporter permease [Sphingomonas sp. Leaf339]|uniref:efflux RND transporter permease subunit n=1 Tax=Sphingomonas sp. Leaf339 TaxID=1736343 RepID=UPI0006FA3B91|nr:efflux RND transporter permease subunit [Sphingomonas sp. Leaf339]KQU61800.1 ABC transporter permease [Sphingomonas sp. Leaf339]